MPNGHKKARIAAGFFNLVVVTGIEPVTPSL